MANMYHDLFKTVSTSKCNQEWTHRGVINKSTYLPLDGPVCLALPGAGQIAGRLLLLIRPLHHERHADGHFCWWLGGRLGRLRRRAGRAAAEGRFGGRVRTSVVTHITYVRRRIFYNKKSQQFKFWSEDNFKINELEIVYLKVTNNFNFIVQIQLALWIVLQEIFVC